MDEAKEKIMDSIASFKSGESITITSRQQHIFTQNQMLNLLVSSNRYGYIFYATETDGLAIISSTYIDQISRRLSSTVGDADDDDNSTSNENTNLRNNAIIRRPYLPGLPTNKTSSLIPSWISLNADETILAIILFQSDTQSCLIIFYNVVELIQTPTASPICSPLCLPKDDIGDCIQNFTWNPAQPNIFAYLDGLGSVSTCDIDLNSKQLKPLGKCDANDDYSSICWSPKGKQIVVVTYEGALALYEPDMKFKKNYPSAITDASFPPCISVLWVSTHEFFLGFSENSDNGNDNAFCHVSVIYNKDPTPKTQTFISQFFDAPDAPPNISSQYHYVRLDDRVIVCGLSKSLKINVVGPDQSAQDLLHTWTFEDQFRATVKCPKNVNNQRPILTGMALSLNSTLSITERTQKLPSCPILLLANSEGLLQVYYFFHPTLASKCRAPEVIKPISTTPLQTSTFTSLPQTFVPMQPSTNGFSLAKMSSAPSSTPMIASQLKEKSVTNTFNFVQQPAQTTNGSSLDDLTKAMGTNMFSTPYPAVQTPTKSTITTDQSASPSTFDTTKVLQIINDFQSKLQAVQKPLTKPSEASTSLDASLRNLTATLTDMSTVFQTSTQSIKTVTKEHIESLNKIENSRHQMKSSQKENLHYSLKGRELDPWTQSRLDTIKMKYDQLKHDLSVLIQVTHTTIHDKSLTTDDNETENEDFIPDLEISLNQNETLKKRLQNRVVELSHKVVDVDKDLQTICSKFNTDLLSSKALDSTFDKTTMSTERPFHSLDADIFSYLQANRREVVPIHIPPPTVINLSSTIEQKSQSTIEVSKPTTPSIPPTTSSILSTTPKQPNSPSVDPESFKNMLRIVRTSIDLFSGATSPDQLQDLSNTLTTSPLASMQKSNITPSSKTPIMPKTTNLSKTSTTGRPSNPASILQTPAKSMTSPVPAISVTPATPGTQILPSDAALRSQLTKTSTVGDNSIRSLLNNTPTVATTITSIPSQSGIISAPHPVVTSTFFGNLPSTSAAPIPIQSALPTPVTSGISLQSPFSLTSISSTITTSVQPTSPTTRPLTSSSSNAFGSKPILGATPLNLTSTPSSTAFSNPAATTSAGTLFDSATATTTSAPSAFGSGFGVVTSTATTSAPSSSPFGGATSSPPSPFGSGFGGPTTSAATATATSPFGGGFGTAPAIAATGSTTSPFGGGFGTSTTVTTTTSTASPFGGGFGTPSTTTTTASPFGGAFGTTTTSTTSPFGGGFGAPTTTTSTSAPSPGLFSGGFSSGATGASPFGTSFGQTASPSTASSFGGGFGNAPSASTGTVFGGFSASSTAPTSTTTGSGGFGYGSSSPATSTASTIAGGTAFGASPTFGSSFTGFGTQPKPPGTSTGFTFAGFSSQSSDATAPQQTFASFGSPTGTTQSASSLGGSLFGGAPTQPTSFNTAGASTFGGPSTQSPSSPSFTAYRK